MRERVKGYCQTVYSIGMEVIWSQYDTSRSIHDNLLFASISHLIYTMTDYDSRPLSQKWRPSKVDTVKPHFTVTVTNDIAVSGDGPKIFANALCSY